MDTDSSKSINANEFCWPDESIPDSHAYLAPTIMSELGLLFRNTKNVPIRILDLGCGNGTFSVRMANAGYAIIACDHSISGVSLAKECFPEIEFFVHDINETLPKKYMAQFDVVVSLEVVEHLFQPRVLFDRAKEALKPKGMLIISTPYHGYIKNLMLALFNKYDEHWHPLRDFGHIKFFSKNTLTQCISECGFHLKSFYRVGRIQPLAKSMIAVAEWR